jgi:hypothetical protein
MKKPKSGSIWKDSSTGAMYRVAHVTRNHVLLVGDLGAHTVQNYEWPGAFVLVESDEDESEDIIALLVGGATGQHFQRAWEQAAELGVDIEYHWPYDVKNIPTKIPSDVNLVIALVSHVSHDAYGNSKKMAKSSRIPFARAPSAGFQGSLAEELKKLGFGDSFGAVILEEDGDGFHAIFIPAKQGRKAAREGVYTWTGTEYVYQEIHSTDLALPSQHAMKEHVEGAAIDALVAAFGLAALLWSSR